MCLYSCNITLGFVQYCKLLPFSAIIPAQVWCFSYLLMVVIEGYLLNCMLQSTIPTGITVTTSSAIGDILGVQY